MEPLERFEPSLIFNTVDLIGVLGNGILGGVVARQMKFDAVGFLVLALLSGLGGGMLRDTLLQAGPPVALTNPAYLVTVLIAATIAYLLPMESRWEKRLLVLADALALGCWSATGTSKALTFGMEWMPAILLGVTTAVGGGMIRDVVVGRTPMIFGGNPLYATAAMLGSVEMVVFHALGLSDVGMAASILTAGGLYVIARRYRWHLPGPRELRVPKRRGNKTSRHENPGQDESA